MLSTLILTAILTNSPNIELGDRVIWGESNNCKGIVLYIDKKLVHVKGYCKLGNVNFHVNEYLNINELKKDN